LSLHSLLIIYIDATSSNPHPTISKAAGEEPGSGTSSMSLPGNKVDTSNDTLGEFVEEQEEISDGLGSLEN
jgi:hypothetical protein